ncbi:MAG TPA: hypothetical protein LFW21_04235 [Rickettsia endosymbiont of Pyrocoelia pectoralis]|nr:hypothetical protein [Rickettsia endosymbiont of Pyrocoelia pectoralis]
MYPRGYEALTKILKNCNQKILNPDNPISFSELISKHFDSSFIFKGNEEILKTLCNFAYEHNITAIWGIKNLGVCILKPASLISTELAAIENSDNPNDLEIIGDHNSAN